MAKYLQLEYRTGLFYEYSGTEKEGYEKYQATNGSVSYRRYYKSGVTGVLQSVSIYDGNFGKQISFTVKDGDNDFVYIPIQLHNQKGQIDNNYAESAIKFLPNLNKEDNITISGYNFKPEDSKYSKIGISIKVDGEKVEQGLKNSYYKDEKLVEGDIPAIIWEEDKLSKGKKKPRLSSIEEHDDFLVKVLVEQTERLAREDNNNQDEQVSSKQTVNQEVEEEDDLPF